MTILSVISGGSVGDSALFPSSDSQRDLGRALPRLIWKVRQGPLLVPLPFADPERLLGLNLAQGCAHGCPFCISRAYSSFPGDKFLYLFRDSAQQLKDELSQRGSALRAVFLSPSTDPFPPIAEVQTEAAKVVDVLAAHQVQPWLMTRGLIRPMAARRLVANRAQVKLTVAMTTMDRRLQRLLEPLAAPPRLRLGQIARLRQAGVSVHVAVEPLVPGVTDSRSNLVQLLDALSSVGVREITAGYMFLRSGIRDQWFEALRPLGLDRPVSSEFQNGPYLKSPASPPAQYLPKYRRQRGYAILMALAAERGITVRISALANPDFHQRPVSSSQPDGGQPSLPCF
jgi:DNA repair photolyase